MERIAWGSAVSFIGNQREVLALQKNGKKKLFFPRFGRTYYSLADNEPDGLMEELKK